LSHRVAVMYAGRIVESADADELFDRPVHPYTHRLRSAVLEPIPGRRPVAPAWRCGEWSDTALPLAGCAYHRRCPFADQRCRIATPSLEAKPLLGQTHLVACHRPEAVLDNS
jgi:oligopeptide/dipeptide ABC transporter ATP-binding protein